MLEEAIEKLIRGQDLSQEEAYQSLRRIFEGRVSAVKLAAFLTGLRIKGEAIEEILGATRAIREAAKKLRLKGQYLVMDRQEINLDKETIQLTSNNRTGGTRTFNISTATAFVVAAAGVPVAKYGTITPSDYCGSEKVLRALGINLEATTTQVERCLNRLSLGFLYAQSYPEVDEVILKVRHELGFRTLFNLLGPLTNPAGASAYYLGVYRESMVEPMIEVLKGLDARSAIVVHGEDTLDEASITGRTHIGEFIEGKKRFYEILPEYFGLQRANPEAIAGGDAARNAEIIRSVLGGSPGPARDIVILNASLALKAAGRVASIEDGISLASEAIDNGEAARKLGALISITNEDVFHRRQY